jgi:hypothetical protein
LPAAPGLLPALAPTGNETAAYHFPASGTRDSGAFVPDGRRKLLGNGKIRER